MFAPRPPGETAGPQEEAHAARPAPSVDAVDKVTVTESKDDDTMRSCQGAAAANTLN